MSAVSRIWLALCLFFSAGCGEVSYSSNAGSYNGTVNRCKKNKDCGAGFQCDTDYSMCVSSEGVANRQLYLKITPKNSKAQVFLLTFDDTGAQSVALSSPRTVEASVRNEDDSAIPARVVVTDLSAVPGRALSIASTEVSSSTDFDTATFSLFEGENRYRLKVAPKSSDEYPPRYFDDVSVVWDSNLKAASFRDSDGNDLSELTVLAGKTEIKGKILRGVQPAAGLTVEITDPDTGRSLSTRTVTGCLDDGEDDSAVCGDFILQSALSEDEIYHLKIWNANDSSYPVAVIPSTAATVEDSVTVFSLSALSTPVYFGARIERPRTLSSGSVVHDGLADCLVILEAALGSGGNESIFLNAVTDKTGDMIGLDEDSRLYLYPAYYDITVIPPSADGDEAEDYAVLTGARRIDNTEGSVENQVFILEYRRRVSVRVTANGKPVPGSSIEATPLNPSSEYISSSFSTADTDGTHHLWLDVGRHRLTVKVPYESRFAYTVKEVLIEAAEEDAGDTGLVPEEIVLDDIALSEPSAARLSVSSDDASLGGAEVEWYEQLSGTSFILVAQSTLDADGNTVGLLPPR